MISPDYLKLNSQFHKECASYGTSGQKYSSDVERIAAQVGAETILDYGCGKCTLSKSLPHLNITNYDPCIEELDKPPAAADLVVCTDVLEHVEKEYIDSVINELKRLSRKAIFLYVGTIPACKNLPDGRNAHISIHDSEWWLDKFSDMELIEYENLGKGFKAVLI